MDIVIDKIPNHVAIVPDGNRRWAKERNFELWKGHEEGAKKIEEITKEAFELGVRYLTFWGSSEDNLQKRSLAEKKALLKIYEQHFKRLIASEEVYENEARINVIGRWKEQFPRSLVEIINDGIKRTKDHSRHVLTFLLAYGGDDDVVCAVKSIISKAIEKKRKFSITKENFGNYLMTSSLPSVDFLIRTGVDDDPHNSVGFLMWQTRNSQYHFSDKMFPDFSAEEFKRSLVDFAERERRMGK